MIRVLIAEDHVTFRAGLASILASAGDIEVVGAVGDGLSAVRAAMSTRPDVVLMDIRMPGIDGVQATKRLVDEEVCDVLVLTTFDLDEYVDAALRAGAAGFLLKSADADQLRDAVRAVARGEGVLAPQITRRVIHGFAGAEPGPRPDQPGLDDLTARERDVLECVGRGLSNAGIARSLGITEATTKTHVSRVMAKLGVGSRTQAAIVARASGMVR